MRFTTHFIRTQKEAPAGTESRNAELLVRAGFIHQEMAGVYTFLPLGLSVLRKITQIVREEMNMMGAVELTMPSLCPKANWDATNRWEGFDVLYKLETATGSMAALCPTHEEVITPLVKHYTRSYKDLPVCLYQFQNKFRNEPRAKSGLLRCREFLMKDAYSFHTSEEDFEAYYSRMTDAYHRVFERLGIGETTLLVKADGGAFSEFSHEFQTLSPVGEDVVYIDDETGEAWNKEIVTPEMEQKLRPEPAVEVGNIFPLATKFSDAFKFTFTDENNKPGQVIMGCYGIGVSRLMGVLAEVRSDEKGLHWTKATAPAAVHLIAQGRDDETFLAADELYSQLTMAGVEVLYDDRNEKKVGLGAKFADADLIGIPTRILMTDKSLENGVVELSERGDDTKEEVKMGAILDVILERV